MHYRIVVFLSWQNAVEKPAVDVHQRCILSYMET